MNIKNLILTAMICCICNVASAAVSAESVISELRNSLVAMPDSIDPDDEEAQERHEVRYPKNTATEVNGLDYVMEHRYRPQHKAFGTKWNDHLYFEAGAGLETLTKVDGWVFHPTGTIRASLGKQFAPWHSARLGFEGGVALKKATKETFFKYGFKADYIFNVSSYLNGYDPTRPVEVQGILGVGGQFSKMSGTSERFTPEAHAGIQLKLYTGSFATINIEPYISITSDKYDFSGNRNWRNFDLVYGMQVSFSHFFKDNVRYSAFHDPDSVRMMRHAGAGPWFLQAGMGMNFMSNKDQSFGKTLGHGLQLSLGKWFSPFFALRGNLFGRTSNIDTYITEATSDMAEHTMDRHSTYWGARADLMINPMGFSRSFSWDAPMGINLLFGAEAGFMKLNYTERISNAKTLGAVVGANLWAKISKNMQFYLEPRYTLYANNKEWNGREMTKHINYHNGLSVDVGLTMLLRGTENERDADGRIIDTTGGPRFLVGFLGGLPMVMNRSMVYQEGRNLNYNLGVFAQYRFNGLHGVRLSMSRMALSRPSMCEYFAVQPQGEKVVGERRMGIWNRQFNLGILTADYTLSLTHLLSSRRTYPLEVEFFAGMGIAWMMSQSENIYSEEPVGNSITVTLPASSHYTFGPQMAFDGGLKFEYHATDRISLFAMPTLYFINKLNLPGFSQQRMKQLRMVESLNFGFQYYL